MNVRELIKEIPILAQSGSLDGLVTGLCQDSKTLKKGNVFFAVKGSSFDGNSFTREALKAEASAVVTSNEIQKGSENLIQVKDVRVALGQMASTYFGKPSEELYLCGVTGTNGKTTTTYMIEALTDCGVIGTIDFHYRKKVEPSTHTTPDAIKTQSLLREWRNIGAKAVAMEVSSHGLVQKRLDHLEFDSAIFTNLTRDHLDFHGTMENYIAAKASLFHKLLEGSKKKNKRAILNGEDPYFKELSPPRVPIWTYGFSNGDFQILKMNLSLDGTVLQMRTPLGIFQGHLQMIGRHNVANLMGALAAAIHSGVSLKRAEEKLSQFQGVPGRLQRVHGKNSKINVFIDYAHTDDGLVKVLSFLKATRDHVSPNAKIITVFGCGGDRDKGKRPLLMKAAMESSDKVIVTSDNPRTEDPDLIISDIVKGTAASAKFTMDADRRKAIELAIERADAGDIVLIAGKGHEKYQIIGDKKYPFDDASVAKEILER